jgi:hypothetical protein
MQRRDKIGRAYLNAVNPVVNVELDERGTLTFDNAATDARVGSEPEGGYVINWARFDNATGETSPIGGPTATTGRRATAPGALPSQPGTFVKVQIAAVRPAIPSWTVPIDVYLRRGATGWMVVGIERLPR